MTKLLNQLSSILVLARIYRDLVTDGPVDFEHEGDDNIEHDKSANDPEGREVEPWPGRAHDYAVHISCLIPIVHDDNMEQSHHARIQVVKVDKEVHVRRLNLILFDTDSRDRTSVEKLADDCVEEHD